MSQDRSKSPEEQLDQSTAETMMSLQDNRANSNMELNSSNAMEDLLQRLKDSESNNLKLVDEKNELMAKLSRAETQVRDCRTVCNIRADFTEALVWKNSICSKRNKELESQLRREQVEKETCLQRTKELESLVETSDLKVNTLRDQLRREQVEKETCLQKIKELESLVEATENKWLNLKKDSENNAQKTEEDIKFLIVKSIKLQELALMSDSEKARRSKCLLLLQKQQEKTQKEQTERQLKERKKEEEIEKFKRVEELKEKWIQGRLAEEEREMALRERKKQDKIEKHKREKELIDKNKQEKNKQQKIAKELIEKLRVRR